MQALVDRIRSEGRNLGRNILKVDGFINHQLDPVLTMQMGQAFAEQFAAAGVTGVTKIITAEVSGIAPALATGVALGVPVVYARKKRPITMPDGTYEAEAPSPTKGGITRLIVSPEYLLPTDRVLLIDDFLASGSDHQGPGQRDRQVWGHPVRHRLCDRKGLPAWPGRTGRPGRAHRHPGRDRKHGRRRHPSAG